MTRLGNRVPIEKLEVCSYTIPTDLPESDGTLEWDQTTIVLVHAHAGGRSGMGYTYADNATAKLIHSKLARTVQGRDALDIPGCSQAMWHEIRNLGHPGITAMAISAVDCALWDLKARLLDVPLVRLLGRVREGAPVYGSGGFTSYTIAQLEEQLGAWAANGIPRVKMKIGRNAGADIERVEAARTVIGPDVELFVDANGAYSRKEALKQAERFTRFDVKWFEEPVSSDDLDGLRLIRDRAPAGMDIAAGEYGYTLWYFRRMLDAGAVDVLQADVTRCGGITTFLQVDALCQARSMQLSAHTAPSVSMHACCATPSVRHLEYFHDHARIESMLFDGPVAPVKGELRPDLSRPGMGLELKRADAQRFAA
jgi:L-alanine-DL-glutamate epimerase-like enolase superfamily enzyme